MLLTMGKEKFLNFNKIVEGQIFGKVENGYDMTCPRYIFKVI